MLSKLNSLQARSAFPFLYATGLVVLLVVILALLFIPVPSHTFLWKAVNNFAHVPLFGVVAIVLLHLSRMVFAPFRWLPIRHYVVAMMGVLALALMTEMLQSFSATRQSEILDVVHDLIGGLCGLAMFLTGDQHLSGKWAQWKEFPKKTYMHLGILVVMITLLMPPFEWVYAYWDRASRFPSMLEFSTRVEMKFVKTFDSELKVVSPPEGWQQSDNGKVGRVVFFNKTYPGIRLLEPYPDWRGYTYFELDIFSELGTTQSITIRIDDRHHNNEHSDRFNKAFTILPGLNHIQIPLDDIRVAPLDRELDLSAVQTVLIFSVQPPQEFTLFVDGLRLANDPSSDSVAVD